MSETAYHHGNLREALLDRAVTVIGEKGVEGVSLRALARDLGVSHAAPARHFPSKADLLAAIVRTGYQRLTDATLAAAEQAGEDPILRLHLLVRAAIRWATENKAYFASIMNPDVRHFADNDVKEALRDYFTTLTGAAAKAQAAGLFAERPINAALLHGIAATIGTQLLFTDELMQETLGRMEEATIDEIVEMIVPLAPVQK